MNMDICFWNMMIDNPNITVCATRYSTQDVPDVAFFINGQIWRGTWSQIDDSPTFWMVQITEREWRNILPN